MYETRKRSVINSISYRLYQSFLVSPLIIYFLTRKLTLAFSFSVIEFIVKIPSYYIFERIWSKVKHGYKVRE